MGLRLSLVMAVLAAGLAFAAPQAHARAFEPGQTIELVTRLDGVPSYARPGATERAVLFPSGAPVDVIARDAFTGWLLVSGRRLEDGAPHDGWVAPGLIAPETVPEATPVAAAPAPEETSQPPQPVRAAKVNAPTPPARKSPPVPPTPSVPASRPVTDLGWCPERPSAQAEPERLRVMTWNLGGLTGDDPAFAQRDYDRIRCYIRRAAPDVLAVQNVADRAALARVVDEDIYDIRLTGRSVPDGAPGNTGFAVKRGLKITQSAEAETLDVTGEGRLPYGALLSVSFAEETVTVLSVHLADGCRSNKDKGPACGIFQDQSRAVEDWIDGIMHDSSGAVLLVGTFNRYLAAPKDRIWAKWDDKRPRDANLSNLTRLVKQSCGGQDTDEIIDHVIADRSAMDFIDFDRMDIRLVEYRAEDQSVADKLPGHCPIALTLTPPEGFF